MVGAEDDDDFCFVKVTLSASSAFSCLRRCRLVWLIGHLAYANDIEYSFYRVLTCLLVLSVSVRVRV